MSNPVDILINYTATADSLLNDGPKMILFPLKKYYDYIALNDHSNLKIIHPNWLLGPMKIVYEYFKLTKQKVEFSVKPDAMIVYGD